MSLVIPSTSGNPVDPKQLQALDVPLIALTQQCGGDLRHVLFSFFSFLHRRTDFYMVPHPDDISSKMGFREGDAEKLLLAAFRQFPLRRIPKGQEGAPSPVGSKKPSAPPQAQPSKATTSPESPGPTPHTEIKASDTERVASKSTKEPLPDSDVRYTEEGLQVPVGNGGSTKTYKWTQTIEECSVLVGVPKSLRGKDLVVKITPSTLSVKTEKPLEGETEPRVFVEGTLVDKVRADESSWSVEGGVVIVTLEKLKQTFWKTVLEGDEEIDTELVDNRRHIDEYDHATQAKIRRIIFDQEQYHKGGPTSDDILGEKSGIPPLPPGVEYIDKKKLDEEDRKNKHRDN
jgi:hypothetical protein